MAIKRSRLSPAARIMTTLGRKFGVGSVAPTNQEREIVKGTLVRVDRDGFGWVEFTPPVHGFDRGFFNETVNMKGLSLKSLRPSMQILAEVRTTGGDLLRIQRIHNVS